jgi:hypothetical protein
MNWKITAEEQPIDSSVVLVKMNNKFYVGEYQSDHTWFIYSYGWVEGKDIEKWAYIVED